jgi:hypothetical protein
VDDESPTPWEQLLWCPLEELRSLLAADLDQCHMGKSRVLERSDSSTWRSTGGPHGMPGTNVVLMS